MDSKEFKGTCNIVVEPIDKNDESLMKFLKDVEEAAIKVFEDGTKVANFYKWYRQRICYDVNRQLFKANYKYLIENPDLQNIQKQLDYIAFLRTNTTYDYHDLDDWENNFRQLENRYREAIKTETEMQAGSEPNSDRSETIGQSNSNNFKIDWKRDERLLPYLIYLLNDAGFLQVKHQFAFAEKHFTVNGKPIKRENIKGNYNLAGYLEMKEKDLPADAKKLNEIRDKLLQLSEILNSIE